MTPQETQKIVTIKCDRIANVLSGQSAFVVNQVLATMFCDLLLSLPEDQRFKFKLGFNKLVSDIVDEPGDKIQ